MRYLYVKHWGYSGVKTLELNTYSGLVLLNKSNKRIYPLEPINNKDWFWSPYAFDYWYEEAYDPISQRVLK